MIITCLSFTGIGQSGLIDNLLAAYYINNNGIKGDVVEAGVHMGGSIGLLSLAISDDEERVFWCFDTFAGMPEPGEKDPSDAINRFKLLSKGDGYSAWCDTSLDNVRKNLISLNAPISKFKFVEGKVEDTLIKNENLPSTIAILRLDTDWYESTKIELEKLLPRVVQGGIGIIDDYGKWSGSREAVDEYFADRKSPFMFHSGHRRIFVKN